MPREEPSKVTLAKVKDLLGCEVIWGEGLLDTAVEVGCSADLMSDILAYAKPGGLLLTGLINPQSVRTADITEMKGIVYVRGKKPDAESIRLAKEKNIPLLATELLMYEACGRLYVAGLKGCPPNRRGM
jgi:predicted transcriptional regulator